MSGMPFVTSSAGTGEIAAKTGAALEVKFPSVTRWIHVTNIGAADMRVGFTANGVKTIGSDGPYNLTGSGGRYFILPAGDNGTPTSVRLELKCMSVFFLSNTGVETDFSLVAGLTGIAKNQFPTLTGSDEWSGIG